MKPFFFGSSANPLYGVYHPPDGNLTRKEGVLLLSAFGQEYMRAHRAYRQLANLLNKKGFPVLRFDYRGTGDSAGELEDIVLDDWRADIDAAAEELRHTAQVQSVSVVGLRLGALMGAWASEKVDIDRLCLWDPVISGTCYEEELIAILGTEGPSETNHIDDKGTLHYNGFPLYQPFREALKRIDLRSEYPVANQILHVSSKNNTYDKALADVWQNQENYTYQYIDVPGNWTFVDEFGGILLPQPIIKFIVDWFSKESSE